MRLGEYDLTNEVGQPDCGFSVEGRRECTEGAVVIPIEKINPHPDYNPTDLRNRRHDIALLRLSKSVIGLSRKFVMITAYFAHNIITYMQAAVCNLKRNFI